MTQATQMWIKRTALVLAVAIVSTSLLAACGKKNKLEPPEGGTEYPRKYPAP